MLELLDRVKTESLFKMLEGSRGFLLQNKSLRETYDKLWLWYVNIFSSFTLVLKCNSSLFMILNSWSIFSHFLTNINPLVCRLISKTPLTTYSIPCTFLKVTASSPTLVSLEPNLGECHFWKKKKPHQNHNFVQKGSSLKPLFFLKWVMKTRVIVIRTNNATAYLHGHYILHFNRVTIINPSSQSAVSGLFLILGHYIWTSRWFLPFLKYKYSLVIWDSNR